MSHYLRILFRYIQKNFFFFTLGIISGFVVIFMIIKVLVPWLQTRKPVEFVGITGNYTLANLPSEIQSELSYGLTKVSKDGSATSAAAVSWVATDSGKTFIFNLRRDLKWQDGKQFIASSVNYNLADVKVIAVDNYTVKFELSQPFAALPTIVAQPLFRPGLIGLGQAKIKNLKMNGRFLQTLTVTYPNKEIVYRFYPTNRTLMLGFSQGEVQQVKLSLDVPPAMGNISKNSATDYSKQAIAFFNVKGKLADKDLRRALMYAMPANFSAGEMADGPLPKTSWAYNPDLKHYVQNYDTAKKLLVHTEASQGGKIRISAVSQLLTTAHEIANSWKKIGLDVSTEVVDTDPDGFDVFLALVEIPADPDQYLLWHSTSRLNISGYKSPKIDKLLEEGRQTADDKIRKEKYLEFQRAITEELPAAFLFFPKVYTFYRN